LEDLGLDGRIILKMDVKKVVEARTGFMWLKSGGR